MFSENKHVPAVGKIIVKPKAIAKSHKPKNICQKCNIIGGEDLNEIYIKVTRQSILETIELIKKLPSENFRANLTAIDNIRPISVNEKISNRFEEINKQDSFNSIKDKIKIKIFDFNDEFDNEQIEQYIIKQLEKFGFTDKYEFVIYGESIKFIKIEVSSYDDVINIASINGVKSVDFFQEYSLPLSEFVNTDLSIFLDDEYSDSELCIGIIDGGISDTNTLLFPYIIAREVYVPKDYQNSSHGTFIASTIQYGNRLNSIPYENPQRFKFLDVIAILGIGGISEDELMEIIEDVMQKHSETVKVWNISLGLPNKICQESMSDLGIFLDYIQDTYQVQIFVSSGNINNPLRTWPVQADMDEQDRIISPADSVRAITVGSVALYESENSIVKTNEPSPFSRRGPGANYIVKPDVVDFGGNCTVNNDINGLGMKGLDINGQVIEGIGTSYSNPRVVQKFAAICDEMVEKDILLAKAMLIHSARMESRDLLGENQKNIDYYGFGIPSVNTQDILQCSENEVTLVFRQKITRGSHLEMFDFPYPSSLIENGKCFGKIGMTLVYNPTLNENYGKEYCRADVKVSFGTYKHMPDGKTNFKGQIPIDKMWNEKFEESQVKNGFKWSPTKSYYKKIKGISAKDGWKVRIDMTQRNQEQLPEQEFVLIITIKAPEGQDIYSEVVNGLQTNGYHVKNLETKQQIQQRQ